MSAVTSDDVRGIVDQVRSWPENVRIELAQEILSTVQGNGGAPAKRSLKDLLGIMRGAGVPPDDAECQRILEDELVRKPAT
jgi:hypothetical protein